jgi:Arc/MetJ-type ribon-helix-helix transcriptional regulator
MRATLTISLPQPLREKLTRAAKALGLSESEFVRRAVQQQLWDEDFEASRRALVPAARAKGVYTDEDVFKMIS